MPGPNDRFAALAAGRDDEIDLGLGSLLVAAHAYPTLDIPTYLQKIDELADTARATLTDTTSGSQAALALLRFLFHEQGFVGNRDDYYDRRNSYLNEVLDRRTGIPISLTVLHIEVARRLGVHLDGVSFPGHFLAKYAGPEQEPAKPASPSERSARGQFPEQKPDADRRAHRSEAEHTGRSESRSGSQTREPIGAARSDAHGGRSQDDSARGQSPEQIILDPFSGETLDGQTCTERLQAMFGPAARFDRSHLRSATKKEILARMLGNLKQIHLRDGELESALCCSERILQLAPDAAQELRDRGLLYERLECYAAAQSDLERFLEVAPSHETADAIRGRLVSIRQQASSIH